jgi:hypothetical protein
LENTVPWEATPIEYVSELIQTRARPAYIFM